MGSFSEWIRNLFRRRSEPPEQDYVPVSPAEPSLAEPKPAASRRSWLTRWTPGAQRERQIAWLQAGYSEMLNLMRGIHAHLDRQEDVQHKLVAALEQLPPSLESLKSLGKAAEQQVEALSLLREQLAQSVQHDQQLADSMNRFNQTLGLLDETARASGRTVAELVQQAREEDRLLHEMVRRSERRMMIIVGVFVFVVAMLVVAGGVMFYTLQQRAIPKERVPAKTSMPIPEASLLPATTDAVPAAPLPESNPAESGESPSAEPAAAQPDAVPDAPPQGSPEILQSSPAEAAPSDTQSALAPQQDEQPQNKPRKTRKSLWRRRQRAPEEDAQSETSSEEPLP